MENNNENKNYIELHRPRRSANKKQKGFFAGCKKIIHRILICLKLKHLCLLILLPLVFFLVSGFIYKLPEQSINGTLNKDMHQLYPLKNETGKKDSLPGSGVISLNKKINDIYQNTPQLLQTELLYKTDSGSPKLSAPFAFKNAPLLSEKSPNFMENTHAASMHRLQPSLKSDKYSSNTYRSYSKRKKAITPYVNHYADKFGLDRELVMSIIQVESNFIPHALSKDNAHGLMQVVPDMAAAEVNRIFKHNKEISSSDLMHPEQNIYYGTAYLYLLKKYHLSGITDHDSLNYVLIASYNAGSNAVLRHFGKTKAEAVEKINSMTPREVYNSLVQNYRSSETRAYLQRVSANLS